MSERVVKVPDVGEGVAEAELVEWHVAVGDPVEADQPLADVMTDKATVEIPAPVAGTIAWIAGEPGDVLAVGSELVRILTGAAQPAATESAPPAPPADTESAAPAPPPDTEPAPPAPAEPAPPVDHAPNRPQKSQGDGFVPSTALKRGSGADGAGAGGGAATRPRAAPAVRLRAIEAGVDLRQVAGSGPAGRVTHGDLDQFLAGDRADTRRRRRAGPAAGDDEISEVKLIGLRKRIAQRMTEANAHIPHITYVDEVDLTLLQQLRESLNDDADSTDADSTDSTDTATDADRNEGSQRRATPKLTLLPFLIAAVVDAVRAHPQCNAHFDDGPADGAGVLRVHRAVHVGIATQTAHGLLVPVLRHAESLDLFAAAAELARLAAAARDGSATSGELTGSTITITSLGALGGLVTTPIINRPEVAIVGVNKLQVRPVWDGSAFTPRTMMNLSSSFDHRIVDGWDAAQFVQHVKRRLESPARLLLGETST